MASGRVQHPANGLSVVVVDEDKHHTDYLRAMFPQHNLHLTVYNSPIRALNFLKDHAQEVNFLLVAVHMQEVSGFQFLDMAVKMHRNIQVIMMSTTTTMDLMMRCVRLGARFLANKPLDSVTICNLWQHLDLGPQKMDMVQNFIKGSSGNTYGEQRTITHSPDDAESMNSSSSKVQSSVGSNIVNNSDSDSEMVEKNLEESQCSNANQAMSKQR